MMNEQEKQALVTSLRLLTATPKSRKMLGKKLAGKGYAADVIEKTVNSLEGQGLLNDRLFAQSLFHSLMSRRISGRKRIAFEMKKRGIDGSLIEEFLESYGAEEEHAKASELAMQKYERWQNIDKLKREKKIYDFLVRRGFDFSLAREVAREIKRGKE
jgi:regulatory protein